MSRAYYNEFDPFAAAWLRVLIDAGHIAPGDVDTRSITEVSPDDVRGYTQVHLFAGIGGWSLALRLAGWPDERPVWTGSCPCQPFSVAGKRKGSEDHRHLWPEMFRLVGVRRPSVVFGEQVASSDGLGWLDGVFADLEGAGYACGSSDLCAAGVEAPHIRQRLYWVADAGRERSGAGRGFGRGVEAAVGREPGKHAQPRGVACGLADAQLQRAGVGVSGIEGRAGQPGDRPAIDGESGTGRLADVSRGGFGIDGGAPGSAGHAHVGGATRHPGRMGEPIRPGLEGHGGHGDDGREPGRVSAVATGSVAAAGTVGFWSAYDLLPCRDGKARRVEPGTFPLAHGVPGRVGRLRGYGNAIVPQVAATFVTAYLETLPSPSG